MSQSYIEAHKADAAFRALEQQVAEINKKHQELSGRNQTLEKKVEILSKKEEQLEIRIKAAEHNTLARHLNASLTDPHDAINVLHATQTNLPIKNFPKKELDIKTMAPNDVAHILKELESDVTRVISVGERKSRLKEVIGLTLRPAAPPSPSVASSKPAPAPAASNGIPDPAKSSTSSTKSQPKETAAEAARRILAKKQKKSGGV